MPLLWTTLLYASHLIDYLLRIPASMECPSPQLPPMIDGTHPPSRRLMLGAILLPLLALDLQQQRRAVAEPDDEIGKVGMGDAEVLVGYRQFEMVVTGVEGDEVLGLLQAEDRRLLS